MRYPRFIILISLIGTIIVGGGFAFPKYKVYLKEAQNLANLKLFLENQTQYYKEIEETFRKLETKREKIDKVNAMLPNQTDTSALVNYFNETTRANGLFLKSLLISPPTPLKGKERIQQYKIGLRLKGTYPGFKSFIRTIEKSARLFEVEQIFFLTDKAKEISEFELYLKVYSFQ